MTKFQVIEPGSFVIRAARHAADPGLSAEISRTTRVLLPV